MQFTYQSYKEMILSLRNQGYRFVGYDTCDNNQKSVILRHDIDTSLDKAVSLAHLEAELCVKSTYFVLLSSEVYNVMAKASKDKIKTIQNAGHEIGLHFDEMNYAYASLGGSKIKEIILREVIIMEDILQTEIKSVSMHRPSKETLEADYDLSPIINSYGKKFFKEFKYVSDSRRRWREDVMEIIQSEEYDKLHILTHAFWYDDEENDLKETIKEFVKKGNIDRYHIMNKNITDLASILREDEL